MRVIPPQVNLDKQARKLDDLKAQPHAPGPQGKAAKQKKVEKLDRSIKMMLTKELGPMKFKQSLLVCSTSSIRMIDLSSGL